MMRSMSGSFQFSLAFQSPRGIGVFDLLYSDRAVRLCKALIHCYRTGPVFHCIGHLWRRVLFPGIGLSFGFFTLKAYRMLEGSRKRKGGGIEYALYVVPRRV